MVQVLVLFFNIAFAQDSLSYLLDNSQHMNLDKRAGINKPSGSAESFYNFTQPSQFLQVVKSKEEGGYYLRVDKKASGVSDMTEVARKENGIYKTRKVSLDTFQKVTAITDCEGRATLGGLVSDLRCLTVSQEFCQQIAKDGSIGEFESLQRQVQQCQVLEGKLKSLVSIHVQQSKSGELAQRSKADALAMKEAFTQQFRFRFDNTVQAKESEFAKDDRPGIGYAAKIISLCRLQKKSEGPSWATAPANSNGLQNRGNSHAPRSTN